jgi:hypothetical protein
MTFDIEKFRTIYSQFAEIPDATLEFMWNNALMISGLEHDTRVPDEEKENLLFMLVCHLATLATRGTAGAMTSAKQGEVQVTYSDPTSNPGTDGGWYMLTPCGSAYWQIIKKYRMGGLWFKGRKTL